MQLFCQTCQAAFAGASHCPKCGVRLLSPQESFIFSGSPKDPPADPDPPTLANRVAVGAGVGLGLYFGVREAAIACGAITPGAPLLAGFGGVLDLVLRVAAVLAGAVLAGAGREQGLPTGLAAGLAIAGALAAGDVYTAGGLAAAGTTPLILAGLLAAAAGPAGAIGARVWPPAPDLPQVTPGRGSSHGSSLTRMAEEDAELRTPRPTAWLRILAGAAVASAGLLASEEIRYWLARGSLGMLHTAGAQRGPAVGFQIAVFLLGLGGVLAGAATGAGFKHGLFAALLAAVGVYTAAVNRPTPFPAIDGYYITFDRTPEPVTDPGAAAEVIGLVLGVCTVGGWLGGQLFPPLAHPAMRKRRLVRQV